MFSDGNFDYYIICTCHWLNKTDAIQAQMHLLSYQSAVNQNSILALLVRSLARSRKYLELVKSVILHSSTLLASKLLRLHPFKMFNEHPTPP